MKSFFDQIYSATFGTGLMEALLTVGLILGVFVIVAVAMYVFSDDINEVIERRE